MSESEILEYSKRVLLCRMRLLNTHPFFGLLLMHMKFSIREDITTAATDGNTIIFAPSFMDSISDVELDFVLMHEVLHVALQHCLRGREYDNYLFNVACDIVVNSNILRANAMNPKSITLSNFGESMHIAPDGKEGYYYTAEEVYNMLLDNSGKTHNSGFASKSGANSKHGAPIQGTSGSDGSAKSTAERLKECNGTDAIWDNHAEWGENKELSDKIVSRVMDAANAIKSRDPSSARGLLPLAAERMLKDLRSAQNDWRTILASFIDEEICDYSFSPPDKRYDSSGFYLPDYNEVEEKIDNILFMIDTSGSMSDKMISDCYSEIRGAIDCFGGHLQGWLGFFDAVVIEPRRFDTVDEFSLIRPKGGGGTRFDIIFDYVNEKMQQTPPVSIIILTDGYAPFPDEEMTRGIPVLWVINNDTVEPPFGKVARIS